MIVEATFTGTDSLGYKHGETYQLIVNRQHPHYPVTISRTTGGGWCPYASEKAFETNWSLVGKTAEARNDDQN